MTDIYLSSFPKFLWSLLVHSLDNVHGSDSLGGCLDTRQDLLLPRHPVLDVELDLGDGILYHGSVTRVYHIRFQLQNFL